MKSEKRSLLPGRNSSKSEAKKRKSYPENKEGKKGHKNAQQRKTSQTMGGDFFQSIHGLID